MTLTREARIAALVRRGILPSTAERIVNASDALGARVLTADELAAAYPNDEAAIEQARLWWLYSPDVPQAWRRILDAPQVPDGA